uniref:Uncharacterized protein n=1 Tax=Oryza rufipogon TaxID=4529 RepID=A0A0E0N8P1_ORYRU
MRTACAASTICHPPSLSFSNPSTASSLSRRRGAAEEDETMGGAGAAEDGRFARPAPSSPRAKGQAIPWIIRTQSVVSGQDNPASITKDTI